MNFWQSDPGDPPSQLLLAYYGGAVRRSCAFSLFSCFHVTIASRPATCYDPLASAGVTAPREKTAHVGMPTRSSLYSDASVVWLQARVRGEPQGSPLHSPCFIEAWLHPKQIRQEAVEELGEVGTVALVEQPSDSAQQVAQQVAGT